MLSPSQEKGPADVTASVVRPASTVQGADRQLTFPERDSSIHNRHKELAVQHSESTPRGSAPCKRAQWDDEDPPLVWVGVVGRTTRVG